MACQVRMEQDEGLGFGEEFESKTRIEKVAADMLSMSALYIKWYQFPCLVEADFPSSLQLEGIRRELLGTFKHYWGPIEIEEKSCLVTGITLTLRRFPLLDRKN